MSTKLRRAKQKLRSSSLDAEKNAKEQSKGWLPSALSQAHKEEGEEDGELEFFSRQEQLPTMNLSYRMDPLLLTCRAASCVEIFQVSLVMMSSSPYACGEDINGMMLPGNRLLVCTWGYSRDSCVLVAAWISIYCSCFLCCSFLLAFSNKPSAHSFLLLYLPRRNKKWKLNTLTHALSQLIQDIMISN